MRKNIFKVYILLALLLLPIFALRAYADTLYFKNGRSIDGIIKNENEETIELDVGFGTVKFGRGEIERIGKSNYQQLEAIRQKWEKQRLEIEKRASQEKHQEDNRPKQVDVFQEQGHIITDVLLNRRVRASLLLDTGASLVVLKKSVAKKLGINLDEVKIEATLIVGDGREVKAKYVVLESVRVKNVEANNVEAVILLDDASGATFKDGLLGMSFLKNFNFKIDYKNQKLILEKIR